MMAPSIKVYDALLQRYVDVESLPETNCKCFGVATEDAIRTSPYTYEGFRIPIVLYRCIEYLDYTDSLSKEGIFRYLAPKEMLDKLEEEFNKQGDLRLTNLPQECILTLNQVEEFDKIKTNSNTNANSDTHNSESSSELHSSSMSYSASDTAILDSNDNSYTSLNEFRTPSFNARRRRFSRAAIGRDRQGSTITMKSLEAFDLSNNSSTESAEFVRRTSAYDDIKEESDNDNTIVSPHAVATLFKRYLRKLNSHLITNETTERIKDILSQDLTNNQTDRLNKIANVIGMIDYNKLSILICTMRYLDKVLQSSKDNKISINGLAVLFNANVTDDFKGNDIDVFIELIKNRKFYFFDDSTLNVYRKSIKKQIIDRTNDRNNETLITEETSQRNTKEDKNRQLGTSGSKENTTAAPHGIKTPSAEISKWYGKLKKTIL